MRLFLHAFGVLLGALLALPAEAAPNASVVNANVNCRRNPPQFGASTLVTLSLKNGDLVAVLPVKTRVEVIGQQVVANRDDWFLVRSGATQCWVYAGPRGGTRYLQIDPGVKLGLAQPESGWAAAFAAVPLGTAHAAQAQPARDLPVAAEPEVSVRPLMNLAVAAGAVVVFVAALVCIRRFVFPQSPALTMACSLSVLLLLGVLSETTFASLLTQLVTPR